MLENYLRTLIAEQIFFGHFTKISKIGMTIMNERQSEIKYFDCLHKDFNDLHNATAILRTLSIAVFDIAHYEYLIILHYDDAITINLTLYQTLLFCIR